MKEIEEEIIVSVKLSTTSELFKKHFSNVYGSVGAGIFHPNMELFFSELNDVCKIEDSLKIINSNNQPKSLP